MKAVLKENEIIIAGETIEECLALRYLTQSEPHPERLFTIVTGTDKETNEYLI